MPVALVALVALALALAAAAAVRVQVVVQAAQVVAVVDRPSRTYSLTRNAKELIMKKTKVNSGLLTLVLASAVSLAGAIATFPANAQDQTRDQTQDRTQLRTQDQIYGSQLMTQAEREEYRARMRSLQTEEERNTFRLQHHQQMQERARAQGLQLPDEPPLRRLGPGAGPGGGPMRKM